MATLDDWKEKVAGRSALDADEFQDLIPRTNNREFLREAFGALPGGRTLIERVENLLSENNNSSLYVIPKKENWLPEEKIRQYLKSYCDNLAKYAKTIEREDLGSQANSSSIQVVYDNDKFYEIIQSEPFPHSEILSEIEYRYIEYLGRVGNYMYALDEAVLALTKYPAVTRYILEQAANFPLEHKPYYEMWKAGGDVYFFTDRILLLCEHGPS